MPEQTLLDYVKQTQAQGFSEPEIRQALKQAGWPEPDIAAAFQEFKNSSTPARAQEPAREATLEESASFFTRHRRQLITALIILVTLPILTFGGLWLYGRLKLNQTAPSSSQQPTPSPTPPPASPTEEEPAKSRDQKRLSDIQNIQSVLDKYFQDNRLYPAQLSALLTQGYLASLPRDPSGKENYLYTPLGTPPLVYSLAFILETDIGLRKAGLQVVSSEEPLAADTLRQQEELVQGITTTTPSPSVQITNLAESAFYPQEEVSLEVSAPAELRLTQALLVMDILKLTDSSRPFAFRFTAPSQPGSYPVKVFAFDESGQSYFQQTVLVVE